MLNNLAHALSAIQNGYSGKCSSVFIPRTFLNYIVLINLYEAGYIAGFSISSINKYKYSVQMKYLNLNEPALRHFKMISKPSQRVFMSVSELKYKFRSNDFVLLQSSCIKSITYSVPAIGDFDMFSRRRTGIINLKKAIVANHGGEVLLSVL